MNLRPTSFAAFSYTEIMLYYQFTIPWSVYGDDRPLNVFIYNKDVYVWFGDLREGINPWAVDLDHRHLSGWEEVVKLELKKREFRKQLSEVLK